MKTTEQQIDSSTFCPSCQAAAPSDAAFCPECGTAVGTNSDQSSMQTIGGLSTFDPSQSSCESTPSHSLSIGSLFAERYLIEEPIGAGGMGVVYRATDTQTKQSVALKLVRFGRTCNDIGVERLKQEGLTTRDIRHKNVVAVYDVSESNGQPFITMEYLEGQSLRQWHNGWKESGSSLSMTIVRQIIEQILDGLATAHDAGVIHRDLKPENIFVTSANEHSVQVKILDFGIARAVGSGNASTGALGTARYMAPEQLTSAELAGPSADLYAVSVMFYELLVDVLPTGHWQPPSTGRTDVPQSIDLLIEKGISNRPANRIQSAREYADALNRSHSENGVKPATPAPIQWLQQLQAFANLKSPNQLKTMSVIGGWCFMGFMGLVLLIAVILDSDAESIQSDVGKGADYGQVQSWDDYKENPQQGYQDIPHQRFNPNYYPNQ